MDEIQKVITERTIRRIDLGNQLIKKLEEMFKKSDTRPLTTDDQQPPTKITIPIVYDRPRRDHE